MKTSRIISLITATFVTGLLVNTASAATIKIYNATDIPFKVQLVADAQAGQTLPAVVSEALKKHTVQGRTDISPIHKVESKQFREITIENDLLKMVKNLFLTTEKARWHREEMGAPVGARTLPVKNYKPTSGNVNIIIKYAGDKGKGQAGMLEVVAQ